MKDFHLPLHSRSVFRELVSARNNVMYCNNFGLNGKSTLIVCRKRGASGQGKRSGEVQSEPFLAQQVRNTITIGLCVAGERPPCPLVVV